jgi:hypothetical protein
MAEVKANGRAFLRNVRHGLFMLPFAVRENMGLGCPVDPSFAVGGERHKNPYAEKLALAEARHHHRRCAVGAPVMISPLSPAAPVHSQLRTDVSPHSANHFRSSFMPGPLSGLRVLDLSRVLAGPWATQILADFGAEVIKIEKPGEGDDTRGWGPPFITNADGTKGDAAYFLSANRGKWSVAIDMATPEGQQLIRDLAKQSDIVMENFKVGGLKKYGLDYESLKAVNPRLIYCSLTGFGQTGPYAQRAGYDFMIQGMGGIMSVTGQPDGHPVRSP